MVPTKFKGNADFGKVIINEHCIVGSNSTLLPNITLNVGSSVGANSLVNCDLDEWILYGGIPANKIKSRDKDKILELERRFLEETHE